MAAIDDIHGNLRSATLVSCNETWQDNTVLCILNLRIMARQIAFADITAAERSLHSILLKKDEEALHHLQDHYGQILYQHIYRIVREEIKASVALCETFKKIWLSVGVYEPGKSGLQSWMLAIAENCALSWEHETLQHKAISPLAPTGS